MLTVSLQIWGILLKEKLCCPVEQILSFKSSPSEEEDGLRLSHEKVHPNKFSEDCHSHLFSNNFIAFTMKIILLRKRVVDTDVVNDVTCMRQSVITRVGHT